MIEDGYIRLRIILHSTNWMFKIRAVSYTHLDVYKRQEILKEREKGLDNLINIKIKFANEEIFYNMIKK